MPETTPRSAAGTVRPAAWRACAKQRFRRALCSVPAGRLPAALLEQTLEHTVKDIKRKIGLHCSGMFDKERQRAAENGALSSPA